MCWRVINVDSMLNTLAKEILKITPTVTSSFCGIFKKKAIVNYNEGEPRQVYYLDKEAFSPPEGMTFGPSGEIFISNEGDSGKLFQIVLKK